MSTPAAIEEQLGPFAPPVDLGATMTGVARRTAEVMIAEIGTDMTVLPTARHLASWAGRCPGNDQSAGKRRSGRTRKGSKWLGIALEEAALAAIRSKHISRRSTPTAQTTLGSRPRAGRGQTLDADRLLAHVHHRRDYRDLGGDYFHRRDPERHTKRLVAKLEALGHHVTLQPAAA